MTDDTRKLLDLINQSNERDRVIFIDHINARLGNQQLTREDRQALEEALQQIKANGKPPTFPGSSASRGY